MTYTEERLYDKVLWILKRVSNENNFLKEKHEIMNQRTAEVKWDYKKSCYICKENFENKYLKYKKIS